MSDRTQSTRRDLLSQSVKIAAAAGFVSATGFASEPKLDLPVIAGPSPKPIKPDQVIRVGQVGTGGRGSNLYNAILGQQGVIIKAIADPDEPHRNKALQTIKEKRGWEPDVYTGTEDYKKLIARDDIDVVVIATPCYLHARMYLECLAKGKHFYGEKPICIYASEAKALDQAQKKNPKVIAQIGFQRRASDLYAKGIQKIRDGVIGKPMGARIAWNNQWGPVGFKKDGTQIWYGRRKMSGDWMLEQACHSWDVVNWVMGELPIAATGVGRTDVFTDIDPQRDVHDYYLANLEYANGFILDFEHCWIAPKKDPEKRYIGMFERFIGPKGAIDLSDGTFNPRSRQEEIFTIPGERNNLPMTRTAIAKFFETVRSGGKSIADIEIGRRASLIGILVRTAIDEKRRVLMKEIL